ncbi:MAG: PhzF family phenazine biosynthesis protein [Pseudomonadota bacterium]|nr:PhzF family phenazine biosynthesis protein [Pseudomonadota bacterium]
MPRRFFTLDVFTDAALAGNPLAVVLDSGGLDDAAMQRIAGEFNLSETVFVAEPKNPINTAALRIFTPARELPFAGHPTVGTAALLAHLRAPDLLASQDLRVVLEEPIGEVVCVARHRRGAAMAAYFTLPRLPAPMGEPPSADELAHGLGLSRADIGFAEHVPSVYGVGAPHIFIPVATRAAMARADAHKTRWGENGGPSVFLYCPETAQPGSHYHARMFAGGWGVAEDPATGSAAAAFAAVVMAFDRPADGEPMLVIEQGFEMGRPSLISLGLEIEGGALRAATVGGSVVIVAEGTLRL